MQRKCHNHPSLPICCIRLCALAYIGPPRMSRRGTAGVVMWIWYNGLSTLEAATICGHYRHAGWPYHTSRFQCPLYRNHEHAATCVKIMIFTSLFKACLCWCKYCDHAKKCTLPVHTCIYVIQSIVILVISVALTGRAVLCTTVCWLADKLSTAADAIPPPPTRVFNSTAMQPCAAVTAEQTATQEECF